MEKQVKIFYKAYRINPKIVPFSEFLYGVKVELEHGKINRITNVTDDNIFMTAKITLAHIMEYPDYYTRLKIMEKEAKKYWKNRDIKLFKWN